MLSAQIVAALLLYPSILAVFPEAARAQIQVGDSSVGYIDNALIANQVRLRFDAAYGNDVPDRAEFFYAKCGCFRTLSGPLRDETAAGPPDVETNVDYQDIRTYIEHALTPEFSGFVEAPVRFLNPEQNDNTAGFGDMEAGFKWALSTCCHEAITFQLKTYIPTGDSFRGLGTDHVSLEPGILFYRQLGEGWMLEGEVRDWIAIDGSDFAGNVIRYGVGLAYDSCELPFRPVAEFVGWTVLDGLELPEPGPSVDASGTSIVNVKLGARFPVSCDSDLYLGYGRALTNDVWYEDILRVEWRCFY
jgi:hypothetical protein